MCFNIGVIIGPVLGGMLADPVKSYPQLFGPGSFLGGKDGVRWMLHWPFALPNLLSAVYIFASLLAVILGLDEVGVARFCPFIQVANQWTRLMKLLGTEAIGAGNWAKDLPILSPVVGSRSITVPLLATRTMNLSTLMKV